jgi:8-oxo-dGTP pyrophosphatase MutT (NUDIX family)
VRVDDPTLLDAGVPEEVKVNYTGDEYAALDKVITNQIVIGGKDNIKGGAAYAKTTSLWPDGSEDHLSMRELAPWALSQLKLDGSEVGKSLFEAACDTVMCRTRRKRRVTLSLIVGDERLTSVAMCIMKDDKIYAGKEPRKKRRVGQFTIPLGKIDPGEDPKDAIVRECREEGGFVMHPDAVQFAFRFAINYDGVDGHCAVYMADAADVKFDQIEHPDKLKELAFYSAEEIRLDYSADVCSTALNNCIITSNINKEDPKSAKIHKFHYKLQPAALDMPRNVDITREAREKGTATDISKPTRLNNAPSNALGMVLPTHGNDDLHELGGVSQADTEVRVLREDRHYKTEAGYGIVGQTSDTNTEKTVVGGLALPTSCTPNVYAKTAAELRAALQKRIIDKQRPYKKNKAVEARLWKMVSGMIGEDNNAKHQSSHASRSSNGGKIIPSCHRNPRNGPTTAWKTRFCSVYVKWTQSLNSKRMSS